MGLLLSSVSRCVAWIGNTAPIYSQAQHIAGRLRTSNGEDIREEGEIHRLTDVFHSKATIMKAASIPQFLCTAACYGLMKTGGRQLKWRSQYYIEFVSVSEALFFPNCSLLLSLTLGHAWRDQGEQGGSRRSRLVRKWTRHSCVAVCRKRKMHFVHTWIIMNHESHA